MTNYHNFINKIDLQFFKPQCLVFDLVAYILKEEAEYLFQILLIQNLTKFLFIMKSLCINSYAQVFKIMGYLSFWRFNYQLTTYLK